MKNKKEKKSNITDLLLLNLVRLEAACPSKKIKSRR